MGLNFLGKAAVRRSLLTVAALGGIFVGVSVFTFYYAEGASYLSNDPTVCVNCHIMRDQFDSWQKGSHHSAATCNDCHLPQDFPDKLIVKVRNGYNHSARFTLQDFAEPIRIHPGNSEVLQENCRRCHATLIGDIIGHSERPDDKNCVRCHREVGHGAAH